MPGSTVLSPNLKIQVPESVHAEQNWEIGQEFAFVPTPAGVLLVPVPTRESLRGIVAGANTENYRDRNDRY